MTRHHTVSDANVLTEAGRSALQRDGIVVAVGYHPPHDHVVTAVQVEGIVVIVITVLHLDALYLHSVAGQIMLHPAAAVLQRDVPHGDILALDEPQQVGTGDALIVPRQFPESPAPSVDGAIAVDHHVPHLVGIDQLDGVGLCAQRDIVRLHGPVILQVGTAIERGPLLQKQVYIRLQDDRTCLILSCRNHHTSTACLRTVIDGLLNGGRTQHGGVRLGAIDQDVVVGGRSADSE